MGKRGQSEVFTFKNILISAIILVSLIIFLIIIRIMVIESEPVIEVNNTTIENISIQENSVFINETEKKLQLSILTFHNLSDIESIEAVVFGISENRTYNLSQSNFSMPLVLNISGLANLTKIKIYLKINNIKEEYNYTLNETDFRNPETWAVQVINHVKTEIFIPSNPQCQNNSDCNDRLSCTFNFCINKTCAYTPITQCSNNDSCCPSGCNITNDNDCAPVCINNNGVCPSGCNITNDNDCPNCIDNDKDGYYSISSSCASGNDCNDNNKNIHPQSEELCDGVDNNCDSKTDNICSCLGSPINYCKQFNGLKSSGSYTSCASADCSVYEKYCSGKDINKDGIIDVGDLGMLNFDLSGCNYTVWATGNGAGSNWCLGADINQDGMIDIGDWGMLTMGVSGCNASENITIDCYSTLSCSNANAKSGCESILGCSWQKSECTLDSDCPDKNCYNKKCENRKCSYTFNNNPGCIGCGTIISQDNTAITLNNDLRNCGTFGIMINAKNIIIDCQGHEITGVSNPRNYDSSGKEDCSVSAVLNQQVYPSGIAICRNKGYNYQIKNCIIREFLNVGQYGGAIVNYNQHSNSYTGLIKNNQIYNSERGIMQWGEFETIEGNTFDNCNTGIWLDESSGNTIKNNIFRNCKRAIEHYCGPYCKYKESPTSIIENTFINNEQSLFFTTATSIIGVVNNGYIRDNIIKNTLTGDSSYQIIILSNSNAILYFKDNFLNNAPLNPLSFNINENQTSPNPF